MITPLFAYWCFDVVRAIPKDDQVRPAHYVGFRLVSTAPIDLRPRDQVEIDIRSGQMETVRRCGVVI